MCILTFLSFPLFFSFIFLLSRALSLSLSLCRSRAVARCLADKLCRILQLPRARARVWELRNFDLPAQVEKGALGFKKIIYFIFFKGKKILRFLHFSHTHTQTHASLRSARRLPPRCPVEASCGVVTVGEKLLFVGRLSPHSPGDPEKKKAIPYGCLCFFYSFIYFLSFWILFEPFLPLARSLSSPLQYPLFPVTAICADRFAGETRNLALIASSTFMFMRHLCLKAFFPLSSFFFFFFWHI